MEYAPVHEGFSQLMPPSSGMGDDGRDGEVQPEARSSHRWWCWIIGFHPPKYGLTFLTCFYKCQVSLWIKVKNVKYPRCALGMGMFCYSSSVGAKWFGAIATLQKCLQSSRSIGNCLEVTICRCFVLYVRMCAIHEHLWNMHVPWVCLDINTSTVSRCITVWLVLDSFWGPLNPCEPLMPDFGPCHWLPHGR